MTMLNRLSSFADATIRAVAREPRRYAVHLVDRESGRMHCVAGIPLTVFTSDPADVRTELMRNRDPLKWDVLIEQRIPKEI
ncbi:hypothetical protein FQV27_04245 [Paracoccus aurantiacus]|uniref:Uncharacterized protein n=1 Tax=Paracoccus aurantiacus TaxID=2599412 RepID=A0A5C6S9K7_9RHOB|nr:hypothetical protein [Paracoccus aurantiacus]TXB71064.1 hypothetical protein FQV27_04245 [Paracoccus aurantiacus]